MAGAPPLSLDQVQQLARELDAASRAGAEAVRGALPAADLLGHLGAALLLLKEQPTLLELEISDPEVEVVVVGDTHGHFHDVLHMLDKAVGWPSEKRVYVFNGDYVDRGAWGVELLTLLVCLKLALPACVHLLRGNHESAMCTKYYGFMGEVQAKYAERSKDIYQACKKVFSQLPLACVIQKATLVLHGGLFRAPPEARPRAKRRKVSYHARVPLTVGCLADLRKAAKGGQCPDGQGSSLLATDVLWSDPVAVPGMQENVARGVGLVFGPDVTQAFLEANGLKLIIRSHEGPDARDKRSDLPQVLHGYAWDHDTPAGRLLTVFSAPDYPQFIEAGTERWNNLAAVAVLSAAGGYAEPELKTFEAVKPRPSANAYYDYEVFAGSDEELPAGSEDMEGAGTDAEGEAAGAGSCGAAAAAVQRQPSQEDASASAAERVADAVSAAGAVEAAAGAAAGPDDVAMENAAGALAPEAAQPAGPSLSPGLASDGAAGPHAATTPLPPAAADLAAAAPPACVAAAGAGQEGGLGGSPGAVLRPPDEASASTTAGRGGEAGALPTASAAAAGLGRTAADAADAMAAATAVAAAEAVAVASPRPPPCSSRQSHQGVGPGAAGDGGPHVADEGLSSDAGMDAEEAAACVPDATGPSAAGPASFGDAGAGDTGRAADASPCEPAEPEAALC